MRRRVALVAVACCVSWTACSGGRDGGDAAAADVLPADGAVGDAPAPDVPAADTASGPDGAVGADLVGWDGPGPDVPAADVSGPDVPAADVSGPDVPAADVGGPDVPPADVPAEDAPPPPCHENADCDDGVSCTMDLCQGGVCVHEPSGSCTETSCANEFDDDRDGLTDCDDDDCAGELTCTAGEGECADGVDGDGDFLADCVDPDCRQDPACTTCTPAATLACGDTVTTTLAEDGTDTAAVYECGHEWRDYYLESELVYAITAPNDVGIELLAGPWTPDAMEGVQAIVALAGACDTSRCVGQAPPGEPLIVAAEGGETYYFVVETTAFAGEETFDVALRCVERPYCADGADNDGDGPSDCADGDCAGAAGCFCRDALVVADCDTVVRGDTTGLPSRRAGYACGPFEGSAFTAPEQVHAFTAPATGTVRLMLTTPLGRHLIVLDAACDPDAPCLGYEQGQGEVVLDLAVEQGATYHVAVESFFLETAGPYELRIVCEGPEVCDDELDNDLDGVTDCLDTDCKDPAADPTTWDPACAAETVCDDGADNDADGAVDCADADCVEQVGSPDGALCEAAEASCGDGFDNDADHAVDCQDGDCEGRTGPDGAACEAAGETTCDDGLDNDQDGATDCRDPGCAGRPGPEGPACEVRETTCDDGVDNDGDGATDCDDFMPVPELGCTFHPACWESDCGDGVDNDGDGAADCEDWNCRDNEFRPGSCHEQDCADGHDEDFDGLTDCADWDCRTVPPCAEATCADGLDDDGDGLTDCQDWDCAGQDGGGGTCLPGQESFCADGFDNDGDGLADCADGDCAGQPDCFCGGAVPLAGCGATLGGDLTDLVSRSDGFDCNRGPAAGAELVYEFTAAEDGPVRLAAAAGQEDDVSFAVLDATCGRDQASCLAGTGSALAPPLDQLVLPVVFLAAAGETYYVVADTSGAVPSFEATLTCPREALCTPREPLACGGTTTGDTLTAGELVSVCGIGLVGSLAGQAVYAFTAPSDQAVDVVIDVWGAVAVLAGACNPDACIAFAANPWPQGLSFTAKAGATYYIVRLGQITEGVGLTVDCP